MTNSCARDIPHIHPLSLSLFVSISMSFTSRKNARKRLLRTKQKHFTFIAPFHCSCTRKLYTSIILHVFDVSMWWWFGCMHGVINSYRFYGKTLPISLVFVFDWLMCCWLTQIICISLHVFSLEFCCMKRAIKERKVFNVLSESSTSCAHSYFLFEFAVLHIETMKCFSRWWNSSIRLNTLWFQRHIFSLSFVRFNHLILYFVPFARLADKSTY